MTVVGMCNNARAVQVSPALNLPESRSIEGHHRGRAAQSTARRGVERRLDA